MYTIASSLAILLVSALQVSAESHTIKFVNNCGEGSPVLVQGSSTLANGSDYTSDGALTSAIAYLQTGGCGFNGDDCALLEFNMNNPTCEGCGSVADISLIPDHALNVPVAFVFYGGDGNTCDGLGASCASSDCSTAFFESDDTTVQRACQSDDVNLQITFCGSTVSEFTEAVTGSLASLDDDSDSSSASSSSTVASSSSTAVASSSTVAAASTSVSAVANDAVVESTSTASSSSSAAASSATCSRSDKRKRSRRSTELKNKARHQARARSYLNQNSF